MPIKISKMLPDFLGGNIAIKSEYHLRPIIDDTLKISWQVCDKDGQVLDALADNEIDIIFDKISDVDY